MKLNAKYGVKTAAETTSSSTTVSDHFVLVFLPINKHKIYFAFKLRLNLRKKCVCVCVCVWWMGGMFELCCLSVYKALEVLLRGLL
ncbi:hypothetical protein Hanom_Chr01g00033371 [Helianthus anomalus]